MRTLASKLTTDANRYKTANIDRDLDPEQPHDAATILRDPKSGKAAKRVLSDLLAAHPQPLLLTDLTATSRICTALATLGHIDHSRINSESFYRLSPASYEKLR